MNQLVKKKGELDSEDFEKTQKLNEVREEEKKVADELFAKKVYFETYQAFANEVQNKTNSLAAELHEKNEIISELNKKEWIKIYDAELKEIAKLRESIYEKNQQIASLKSEIRQGPK